MAREFWWLERQLATCMKECFFSEYAAGVCRPPLKLHLTWCNLITYGDADGSLRLEVQSNVIHRRLAMYPSIRPGRVQAWHQRAPSDP